MRRVKSHQVGFDTDPFIVSPTCSLADFVQQCEARRATVAAVSSTGDLGGEYLGAVELHDAVFAADK